MYVDVCVSEWVSWGGAICTQWTFFPTSFLFVAKDRIAVLSPSCHISQQVNYMGARDWQLSIKNSVEKHMLWVMDIVNCVMCLNIKGNMCLCYIVFVFIILLFWSPAWGVLWFVKPAQLWMICIKHFIRSSPWSCILTPWEVTEWIFLSVEALGQLVNQTMNK